MTTEVNVKIRNTHIDNDGKMIPMRCRLNGREYRFGPGEVKDVSRGDALYLTQYSPKHFIVVGDTGTLESELTYVFDGAKVFRKNPFTCRWGGNAYIFQHGDAFRGTERLIAFFNNKAQNFDRNAGFRVMHGSVAIEEHAPESVPLSAVQKWAKLKQIAKADFGISLNADAKMESVMADMLASNEAAARAAFDQLGYDVPPEVEAAAALLADDRDETRDGSRTPA